MVCLVSRSGRQLQRYKEGCRQVVGCIPYRYKNENIEEDLEVLVISSQKKRHRMLFPKGGWEIGESMKEAAMRETWEEAGVRGNIEEKLGEWKYKSKRYDTFHEGYMFLLHVQEELESWPEEHVRIRRWMTVNEAREVCQQGWMKEALDKLTLRLTTPQQEEEEDISPCSLSPLSDSDY